MQEKKDFRKELAETARRICTPGKGILAADESEGTIGKKFHTINVENTEENRRKYRQVLFTTPELDQYISGVILFSEQVRQKSDDGKTFAQLLTERGIIPGIKVDKGLQKIPGTEEDSTKGLDSLAAMAAEYYALGCRFAKWRAVLTIDLEKNYPSELAIQENAWGLARYAAICQENGLVPIVEPEILVDGTHTIEDSQRITEKVLSVVFKALQDNNIFFEGCLLKPNMVTPGSKCTTKVSNQEIASRTVIALSRTAVPALVGVCFLSGGQSEEDASLNLNAMNQLIGIHRPWALTFSYGRALQNTAVKTWAGKDENIQAAQEALLIRARANGQAQLGQYQGSDDQSSKESLQVDNYRY